MENFYSLRTFENSRLYHRVAPQFRGWYLIPHGVTLTSENCSEYQISESLALGLIAVANHGKVNERNEK